MIVRQFSADSDATLPSHPKLAKRALRTSLAMALLAVAAFAPAVDAQTFNGSTTDVESTSHFGCALGRWDGGAVRCPSVLRDRLWRA